MFRGWSFVPSSLILVLLRYDRFQPYSSKWMLNLLPPVLNKMCFFWNSSGLSEWSVFSCTISPDVSACHLFKISFQLTPIRLFLNPFPLISQSWFGVRKSFSSFILSQILKFCAVAFHTFQSAIFFLAFPAFRKL